MVGDLGMRRPCAGTGTCPAGGGQELLSKRSLMLKCCCTFYFQDGRGEELC